MLLEFKNFSVEVVDYVEEELPLGSYYITDSKVKEDDFANFLSFYETHLDSYFSIKFNDKNFEGRFGQLIFDNIDGTYNIRLVFVEASCDKNNENNKNSFTSIAVVKTHVEYVNLIKNSIRQELVLSKLSKALKDKGLFNEEELNAIFKPQLSDLEEEKRLLYHKVENLDEYLKNTDNTLSEIKKDLVR